MPGSRREIAGNMGPSFKLSSAISAKPPRILRFNAFFLPRLDHRLRDQFQSCSLSSSFPGSALQLSHLHYRKRRLEGDRGAQESVPDSWGLRGFEPPSFAPSRPRPPDSRPAASPAATYHPASALSRTRQRAEISSVRFHLWKYRLPPGADSSGRP